MEHRSPESSARPPCFDRGVRSVHSLTEDQGACGETFAARPFGVVCSRVVNVWVPQVAVLRDLCCGPRGERVRTKTQVLQYRDLWHPRLRFPHSAHWTERIVSHQSSARRSLISPSCRRRMSQLTAALQADDNPAPTPGAFCTSSGTGSAIFSAGRSVEVKDQPTKKWAISAEFFAGFGWSEKVGFRSFIPVLFREVCGSRLLFRLITIETHGGLVPDSKSASSAAPAPGARRRKSA
jgi:hypothetical protein